MNDQERRDPDSLLEVIKRQEETKTKGRLRIFLGMCPGVGKTYAMLQAARELKAAGKAVIVGVVETHGRKETKNLLDSLPIHPLKNIAYRGTNFKELDLDGLLDLFPKPDLVIVDELAHQNVSGSRHRKRYQDVAELLQAGLNVYTTVNIQHLESRNDQIAQITGVVVKETVPDSFFDNADEIELVDLSPPELLNRLKEGKVYLGERAERAIDNFFQEEKLTALRELALRFTAETVDHDLTEQMTLKGIEGPWNTNERFLVAISSNPYSSRLIRAARRMAASLDSPWIALYVDTGVSLTKEDQKNLELNLNLAKELGAEMITVANTNINQAILKVCVDKNVTQVVIGRPDRNLLKDKLIGASLFDQLISSTGNIDVHVMRSKEASTHRRSFFKWPQFRTKLSAYLLTLMFAVGVSIAFYPIKEYVGYRSLGFGFLLALLVFAGFARRGPTIFIACVFAFIWYFVFITPRFTLQYNEWQDLMMVLSFLVTAMVGGWLTSRIRLQEVLMSKRELRTASLYQFTKAINDTNEIAKILQILSTTVSEMLKSAAKIYLGNDHGGLDLTANEISTKTLAVASWSFEHGKPAGRFTQTLAGSDCFCYPLLDKDNSIGVLIVAPGQKLTTISAEDESLLATLTKQAASAIQRIKFSQSAKVEKTAAWLWTMEATKKAWLRILPLISHYLKLLGSNNQDKSAGTNKMDQFAKIIQQLTTELTANRLDPKTNGYAKLVIKEVLETIKLKLASSDLNPAVLIDAPATSAVYGAKSQLTNALLAVVKNLHQKSNHSLVLSVRELKDNIEVTIKLSEPQIAISKLARSLKKNSTTKKQNSALALDEAMILSLAQLHIVAALHHGSVEASLELAKPQVLVKLPAYQPT